jgi:ADP-ribose pyrophosphatase YjhB (NUDIX family)
MKFCSACGHTVDQIVPPGDNRLRYCCAQCSTIHYENPRMVVGTIPVIGDRVLLCRRAIEPRYGFWTLPAGFMENAETTAEGASRETIEEAGARIDLGELFSMIDVPQVDQVHIFYRATVLHEDFDPGPESLEAKLFLESEIPWDAIAFRTVALTLRWFFEDRQRGAFTTHTGSIRHEPPAVQAGTGG